MIYKGQVLAAADVQKASASIDSIIDGKLAQVQASSAGDVSLESILPDIQAVAPFAEAIARIAEIPTGLRIEDISARYYKTENSFVGVGQWPLRPTHRSDLS